MRHFEISLEAQFHRLYLNMLHELDPNRKIRVEAAITRVNFSPYVFRVLVNEGRAPQVWKKMIKYEVFELSHHSLGTDLLCIIKVDIVMLLARFWFAKNKSDWCMMKIWSVLFFCPYFFPKTPNEMGKGFIFIRAWVFIFKERNNDWWIVKIWAMFFSFLDFGLLKIVKQTEADW